MFAHHNYNYEKLRDEIESLWREKNDSIADFSSRISQIYYRFHDDEQPSEDEFVQFKLYLLHISLSNEENQLLSSELNST